MSAAASAPSLSWDAQGLCVRVLGEWTAARLAQKDALSALQNAAARFKPQAAQALWDLRGAAKLDHLGAQWLWQAWGRQWPQRIELDASQRSVIERVAQFSRTRVDPERTTLMKRFERQGERIWHLWDHLRDFVALIGQTVLSLGHFLRVPAQAPWRDFSGHLYNIGATALPITALVGMLIGVVLAYLTALQLRQFGADAFIVNILGLGLVREIGPMLAAILIAGRSGSAITAQIGVMRVTEELDAMLVMGIPHGARLVLPRALALAIVMPLIAVWTTLVGLLGGMIAADISLGISPQYFIRALPGAVDIANLWLALAKSSVFGILIALVGCHFGLRVKPNTESLGQGTTASVVTSITVVILIDALFAVMFRHIGI
jgi:phospholipid/cholesterol/gamma-HCH transport system permease protein